MPSSVASFTRGSQIVETGGLLFAAGLKPILWVAGIAFTASIAWSLGTKLGPDDRYLCIMHAYAIAWHWMQFAGDKLLQLHGATTGDLTLSITDALTFGPMVEAWHRLTTLLHEGAIRGAIIAIPTSFLYLRLAQRVGNRMAARKHRRGAQLAPREELLQLLKVHNDTNGRRDRGRDYRRLFGAWWQFKAMFTTPAERIAAGMYLPYTITGVPYPWHTEQTHLMLVGTTGTGKSTVLKDLVRQLRERGARAVIFDLTGSFIEAFYDADKDIILNPFDLRCPHWSVFHDAETKEHFTAAAEALVPHDGGAAEPFWVQAARLLFVETCMELKSLGRGTNAALYDELMTAPLKHLHKLVESTVAGPLTDTDAKRMAESVRAVFNTNATALECLPDDGEPFSIREWITDTDENPDSIMFVSARYDQLPTVRPLLTLWLNTAIMTIMGQPTSPRDVRMWFLFDELGALHRLPAIEAGMQTARNFGGAFVLGVHTIAKLRDTYGDKIADTLGSLARTKVILTTADYGSAKWCSDYIGAGEWQQMDEGWSYGINNVRDAVTLTPRRQLEPLILPDTIMNLPSLSGYLKFPENMPAAPIKLTFVDYPKRANGFLRRDAKPHRSQPKRPPETAEGDEGGRSNTADVEQAKGRPMSDAEMRRRRAKVIMKMAREAGPQDRDAVIAQAMARSDNDNRPATVAETTATSGLEAADASRARADADAQSAVAVVATAAARGDDGGNAEVTGSVDPEASPALQALSAQSTGRDDAQDLTIVEARQDFGDGRHGEHDPEIVLDDVGLDR